MIRKPITAMQAPKAVGPYSHAVRTAGLVFTSGQIGLNPATGALVQGGIREQTRQVMENLKCVLEAAGSDLSQVVKATVFLADMRVFAEFNEIYGAYFPLDPPARSAFQVAALPLGAAVEIEMVALIRET